MAKKKIDIKIIIIIILIIILTILVYTFSKNSTYTSINISDETRSEDTISSNDSSTTNSTTISTTGEILSALTENVEVHATYYLEEVLVSENDYVEEGEYILEYSNGEYLQAPYNCVITSINLPNSGEECNNSHYIQIESTNQLSMSITVDETQVDQISIGDEATIKVSALENKEYTGYVTKISSTATNGKFTVTVEFTNDGEISLGMTGTCSIVI